MEVEDVGDKGVGSVEGLQARLTGALSRGEEISLVDLVLEKPLLPQHAEDVAEGDTAVVNGVQGVEGGHLIRFVDGGEEVSGPGEGRTARAEPVV